MRSHRPLTRAAVTVVAVAAIGAGGWLAVDGLHARNAPAPPAPPVPSAADALPVTTGSAPPDSAAPSRSPAPAPRTSTPAPRPPSAMADAPPVRIRIPRIGVDAPVMPLGADAAGHLQVPPAEKGELVGWYEGGPSPGAAGNAIMDGHVDTTRGPAVFYGLGALHKGATVLVTRADRSVAVFSVYAVEVYAKAAFPDQRVYGPTREPELRLLTCGGGYARATGYLGNVVVYARLTAAGQS